MIPTSTPSTLVPIALLLCGCAASPPADRYLLLETESYGCSAEAGLGCGLALDPVLTALDELEGVEESRASWDGRTIRIELAPGADRDRVAAAAAALLEGDERLVLDEAASSGRDDRWWSAEGTLELSLHEAGVIASDFAEGIAAEVELDEESRRRLEEILREEFERAFERAHAAGGGVDRLWDELPDARLRFERSIAFLTPTQREAVGDFLDRELGG